jgi:hypothetical protein
METMTVRVETRSMTPTIQVGEVITVERRTPEVGEVGAFLIGDSLLIHRVMDRWPTAMGEFFVHRGDAGPNHGVVKDHQTVGTVRGIARIEPAGKEATQLWFRGRIARISAAMAISPALRPVFLWLVRGADEADGGGEVPVQAPVNVPEDEFQSDQQLFPGQDWATARLNLIRNAEAELEASEAAAILRGPVRVRGGVAFAISSMESGDESPGEYLPLGEECPTKGAP